MREKIKINLPEDVSVIISILEKNGYEAYAVGGCVRDSILNRKPQDWDITTNAEPADVKRIFKNTIDTGIKHGTVTVLIKGNAYEVTTYRIDGEYLDGRHPENVEFTKDLKEDLRRRDFTINAMAYSEKDGIIDIFGGMDDLENGTIRCVGDAKERFTEDALRILRAFRFSAQLGFDIEKETYKAASDLAKNLQLISAERIRNELEKLIMSDNPNRLLMAYEAGVTKYILPEFDRMVECDQVTVYHCYNVGEHTVKVLENVKKERIIRWTALLHDVAKPEVKIIKQGGRTSFHNHDKVGSRMCVDIFKRLRLDNKTIKIASRLIEFHDDRPDNPKDYSPEFVRRLISRVGKDIFPMFLDLTHADTMGKSEYGIERGEYEFGYVKAVYDEVIENGICTDIKELALSGKDLIEMGFPKGEVIGEILEKLLDAVLREPDLNDKETLTKLAKEVAK